MNEYKKLSDEEMKPDIDFAITYSLDELAGMIQNPPYAPVTVFGGKPVHEILDSSLLPGEIFRNYSKEKIIEVSNLGRIRINNEIIKQWDDDEKGKDYLYIKIGEIIDYPRYVYRFVAETWCRRSNDLSGWQVHHISNNGYDNRPCNLLWVTEEQHKKIHPRLWERYKQTKEPQKINIEWGYPMSELVTRTRSTDHPVFLEKIKNIRQEFDFVDINYGTKSDTYHVFVNDELRYTGRICEEHIDLLHTYSIMVIIRNDIRNDVKKATEYYKGLCVNKEGLKNDDGSINGKNYVARAAKINEGTGLIELRSNIENDCENAMKEVSEIIISKVREIIKKLE
jgi:hypothetical protein